MPRNRWGCPCKIRQLLGVPKHQKTPGSWAGPSFGPMGTPHKTEPSWVFYSSGPIYPNLVLGGGAQKSIDIILGRPLYGFDEGMRDVFMARVRAAGALANNLRQLGDAIDVPFSMHYSCLPRVPSWNRSRIEQLQEMEDGGDLWACELAMAQE
ncbi:hypothetical protein FB451DRAFT_1190893 [Mycena latifolia]|nr:hypothetical protein FB451DRAFT_1190893 [Mycena latifolia]